jgi:hypothetical protein
MIFEAPVIKAGVEPTSYNSSNLSM